VKEILLILKGMSKPHLRDSIVTYGEFCKLMTLILLELAPEEIEEAAKKLKDFDG
jgi:hypothetical protein